MLLQFHRKVEHSGYDEKKAFSEYLTMNPISFICYETQAIQRNENSLDYRLQTVIRKEVQAKKSVR